MIAPINIPLLNPIRLVSPFSKYNGLFFNAIPEHEEQVCYTQKFCNADTIAFQLALPAGAIVDFDANLVGDNEVVQIPWESLTLDDSEYDYFEFSKSLSGISEGIYQVELEVEWNDGKKIYLVSEPMCIKPVHPDTILIHYSHSGNEFGLLFHPEEGDREYMIRVEGGFASDGFLPGSKDVVYRDQPYNTVLLSSVPYATHKITFGDGRGIPNWLADKLNRILSCSEVKLNGEQYTRADGAKMEAVREKGIPLAAWTIELAKIENKYFDLFGLGDYNLDYNEDHLIQIEL